MSVSFLALMSLVVGPCLVAAIGVVIGCMIWLVEEYLVGFHIENSLGKTLVQSLVVFGIAGIIIGVGCFVYGLLEYNLI